MTVSGHVKQDVKYDESYLVNTHIPSFQCRDFRTPVQSVQTDLVSYSLRPSATWSPRNQINHIANPQRLHLQNTFKLQ